MKKKTVTYIFLRGFSYGCFVLYILFEQMFLFSIDYHKRNQNLNKQSFKYIFMQQYLYVVRMIVETALPRRIMCNILLLLLRIQKELQKLGEMNFTDNGNSLSVRKTETISKKKATSSIALSRYGLTRFDYGYFPFSQRKKR